MLWTDFSYEEIFYIVTHIKIDVKYKLLKISGLEATNQ